MTTPKEISLKYAERDHLLGLHDVCLELFGGLPGVREEGALQNAMNRGFNTLAYEPDSDVFKVVGRVGYALSRNHPFSDGNKRTSLAFILVQLQENGYLFDKKEEDLEKFALDIASGSISEEQMIDTLRKNSIPLETSQSKSQGNKFTSALFKAIKAVGRSLIIAIFG